MSLLLLYSELTQQVILAYERFSNLILVVFYEILRLGLLRRTIKKHWVLRLCRVGHKAFFQFKFG